MTGPDPAVDGADEPVAEAVAEAAPVADPDPAAAPDTAAGAPGPRRAALGVSALAVLALVAAAVLGVQALGAGREESDARAATAAARQVALNLTSIRADSADADLQRLLDSATGEFRAQFADRRGPFVEIVQQARVTTTGEVVEAGLQGLDDAGARVLVAVRSEVRNVASDRPEPRNYRLAVTMQRVDGAWLASGVEFVA